MSTKHQPTTLLHGECLEHLRALPSESIDSICTDPPYGLASTSQKQVLDALSRWLSGDREYVPHAKGFMGACFHPDTELLTESGWKRVADARVGERVYSRGKDNQLYRSLVTRTHAYEFDGDLLCISGRSTRQLVTPNHKVLIVDRMRNGSDSPRLVRADELPASFRIPVSADVVTSHPTGFTEFANRKWDDEVLGSLIGLWLGDGYAVLRKSHQKKQDFLGFSAQKSRKVAAIKKALRETDLYWTVNELLGPKTYFYVYDKRLLAELRGFAGATNKRVPEPLFSMSQRGLEALYQGLITTDGSIQGSAGQEVFSTSSPGLADDFQRLCVLTGRASTMKTREGGLAKVFGRETVQNTLYVLSVLPPGKSGVWLERDGRYTTARKQPAAVTKVPYTGNVYCVTVDHDSHTVLTRLHGKMAWSGNSWDSFVPPPAVWDECLRVLKPGGHLAAFAGARTYDLMGMSVRIAGFEVRDGLGWARSGGMPKTQDLGKQMAKAGIDGAEDYAGWSAGLKPAIEPILLARKPFRGSLTSNAAIWGTGALNIDATRIEHRSAADLAESEGKNRHAGFGTKPGGNDVYGDFSMVASKDYDGSKGRWPSNLILDPGQAAQLDEQSGTSKSRRGEPRTSAEPGAGWGSTHTGAEYDDEGGASRFFEITEALDELATRLIFAPRASAAERPVVNGVQHTTVKPLSLMRYLVRLITPIGGTILEPFAGSGTTVEAALLEGFRVLAIEREPDYLPLIEQRIERATKPRKEVAA